MAPPAEGNLIIGCYAGVDILAGADYNVVEGNTIGPDVTGTEAPGNENVLALSNQYGVLLAGSFNTIGGVTAGARNLISGNGIGVSSSRYRGRDRRELHRHRHHGNQSDGEYRLWRGPAYG